MIQENLDPELKQALRKFCTDQIEPKMEEDDQAGSFRMELFNELGNQGYAGMTLPESFGGSELGLSSFCEVLSEVARYSVSYAVTLSVSTMVMSIINEFGNEEQKSTYLPALASGEEIGAFGLTESSSGSDAGSLKTTAKKDGDNYKLNGSKLFITSGGIAKTYIVMAKTGEGPKDISAFIVRDGTAGFEYGKLEKKMGWKISPTRELVFENCQVPATSLLSNEGEGLKIALSALAKGRITIGAIAIGLAERALDEAIKYSLERKQFNQAIYDFQGIQFMISELATEIEAAKLLVQKAAALYDAGRPDSKIASMAKMKSTDVAMKVTTDALQILGGVGYTKEYPLERFMRDAKALQIVEGTNQIQKVIISRELKKEYLK